MNAASLIGRVLGTCTLQKVIGQGGMGAVFLAQQSRPRRQVAVKVLLPATSLTPTQRAAFLERFRRETDAAASLEHQNILQVHEYGELDGIAYLVVPYISGGTLRDLMEREGQLLFDQAAGYVEQIAAALDFAHSKGVIHRDVKPANILMTNDGRLLLTDFGLVKIISDTEQVRLTGAGAPVGTPDYMAPEQVIGDTVDGRSDLYSLGVILFQMVAGTTPFHGETPMQIAAQQLQAQPPSPRIWRPDLPVEAEQVILKAMSKRPADRYTTCKEFYLAFRAALAAASTQSLPVSDTREATASRLFTPRGLFDPAWQIGKVDALPQPEGSKSTKVLPAADVSANRSGGGLLSRTGRFPTVGTGRIPAAAANEAAPALSTTTGASPIIPPKLGLNRPTAAVPAVPAAGVDQVSPVLQSTNTMTVPKTDKNPPSVKLTEPMKIVQVPVTGQPGRFVTGFLPVKPQVQQLSPSSDKLERVKSDRPQKKSLVWIVTLLVIVALIGSLFFVYTRFFARQSSLPGSSIGTGGTTNALPNTQATLSAQATATATSNVLLSDPLTSNIHNFPENQNEFFANGAYHILDTDDNGVAVILAEKPFVQPNTYSLTMEEIKGNDTTATNSFGMIIRFNATNIHGTTVDTFYSLEVTNTRGGSYQFWRYDNSKGPNVNPWTSIWQKPFGSEFHQGQGPRNINTISIREDRSNFTFIVNGTKVGTAHDSAYPSGTLGMLINLKGTEVAFSNMLVTRN